LLRRRFDKLEQSVSRDSQSKKADVAQLVEQPIRNRQVSGSSPLVGSRIHAGSKQSDDLEPVFYPKFLSHVSLTCRLPFGRTIKLPPFGYVPRAALTCAIVIGPLTIFVESPYFTSFMHRYFAFTLVDAVRLAHGSLHFHAVRRNFDHLTHMPVTPALQLNVLTNH
jgi:hypothetical protein